MARKELSVCSIFFAFLTRNGKKRETVQLPGRTLQNTVRVNVAFHTFSRFTLKVVSAATRLYHLA